MEIDKHHLLIVTSHMAIKSIVDAGSLQFSHCLDVDGHSVEHIGKSEKVVCTCAADVRAKSMGKQD